MKGTTHILFGLILATILIEFFNYSSPILAIFLVLLGSLLPDIDERHSKLGRKIPIISFFVKHRTFFHSVLFIAVMMVLLSFFLDTVYVWTFAGAILLHLVLDGLTPQGVTPFWPSKLRIKGFIRVGSALEKLIFFLAVIAFIWLLIK